ncbi:hypothetical protein SRB5_28850 [Streptomyces sp. RB5]|uniref:Uncharacterized protein n=1 Tax=Streptomyces smaragdinus TaxID=2585196 RepID=A0A7K0CH69_9ACTN|nr:hypothetical protein [Streptomyces smaragdinus]
MLAFHWVAWLVRLSPGACHTRFSLGRTHPVRPPRIRVSRLPAAGRETPGHR